MAEYKINILPLEILQPNVVLNFSETEKKGYNRLYKRDLPKQFIKHPSQIQGDFIWWTRHSEHQDDFHYEVNLLDNRRFAKHYINKLIFEYFSKQKLITNNNFIRDTEILIKDSSYTHKDVSKFKRFSIKVDNNFIINNVSLLISFDKNTYLLNKSFGELGAGYESALNKVVFKNKICKYSDLTTDEKKQVNEIFPLLNRDIKRMISFTENRYNENKYKYYFNSISEFYNSYLKNLQIEDSIKIFESGFCNLSEEKINQVSNDSNLLLFGNNQKHFVPYIGLKEFGPLEAPTNKKTKFLFIFHDDDKHLANKLYSFLKKGYKSFPGLESFVNIKFEIDTLKSVTYNSDSPFNEINNKINSIDFDSEETYVALYISRIKRGVEEKDLDNNYYQIKEALINKGIISQVIFSENIENPSFNYFLPNISIALLAKLGGIPWRLYRPIRNDLIIGIGADRSIDTENKLIGSAFCFRNDGKFQGFNAFEKEDTASLAETFKNAIKNYLAENQNVDRLIIHYFKKMSKEEEAPILKTLDHLQLSLPYIVITVNETQSKDYVLFDNSYDGKMPQSGIYVQIKWNQFILCNNTRYSNSTGTRIDGFPLPIKISFKSSNFEKMPDLSIINELIDQVYQFSRMYWKSVRQQNKPVTLEYSELVAKMVARFENKNLQQFAQNTLWFL